MDEMLERLLLSAQHVEQVNRLLGDGSNPVMRGFLDVIRKYGTVEEINRKARGAGKLESLKARLKERGSPFLKDLTWLEGERDRSAFATMDEFRLAATEGRAVDRLASRLAVTLEISAFQYFPWIVTEAQQAIERRELMPGRYIRVRRMKESEQDQGDLLAVVAAMQIVGASYVETLDTKGTDGSNVHLGGPETITGYFGGIGQPNDHALMWVDELLYYYTNYGVRAVLNINPGTVLLGYMLYKVGVDIEFKISVFMGNDNPYAALWTLLGARLFARPDGSTPLIGFNFGNSIDNRTLELSASVREALGFEDIVRFEHHITEAWKSIVRQPYDRRAELVEVAQHVANISAKHEGGEVSTEQAREHPSDLLEYFLAKEDVEQKGLMPALLRNYLDKHDSVNLTARALLAAGIPVVAARRLHGQAL
ncbi:MAG: hypothetical protein NTY23_05280 [Chloroflexi bacterium]|nr:hypothetical protein [Chloroflexota bacterium]